MRIRVGDGEVAFDVDGAQLVPTELGWDERPTVVFLGGGRDAWVRETLGPALAHVAQVVYLDARETSRDDVVAGVDELRRFLDALEIERPVLLATSAHAVAAVAFAATHPDRTSKLVLLGRMTGDAAEAVDGIDCPVLVLEPRSGGGSTLGDVLEFVREPEP